ncbi:cartilage-associated protein-like [Diorhabda carinulata]|uniref:cartilage-associated protein-like n=1 Tax=Diorhabda carinulata TaxID=1163345 RepID=UPI0025A1F5B4|nr:cartilage-associated protein-like [Diorhabda carinulata]
MSVTTCVVKTLLFLNLCLLTHVQSNEGNATENCVQLYEKGVEAYLENSWEDCVTYFEEAIVKYRKYRKQVSSCRLKCRNDAELSEPLYPVDLENLLFFERAIRQTLCIIKCENENKNILENYNVNLETGSLFEQQKPYEYLHICYFQTKQLVKAASSAFTYLVAHPDDKIMSRNLQHYFDHDVDKKDIVNYEAKDYVYLYIHGADAYEKKGWESVVFNMEESLVDYLQAEEECRAQCEGPFDHGWYPDFIASISNHFTVCLKCKQACKKTLSSLNGEIHDDLLPSHYHYLQYAYYKLGNLKAACQAVASYLLFYPDDETMLDNMRYYYKQPKIQKDYFHPRDEATRYVQRQIYENRILKFVNNEFKEIASKTKGEEIKGVSSKIDSTATANS